MNHSKGVGQFWAIDNPPIFFKATGETKETSDANDYSKHNALTCWGFAFCFARFQTYSCPESLTRGKS